MLISDFCAVMAAICLVTAFKAKDIKAKYIGIVPKAATDKLIMFWLDRQYFFAVIFCLFAWLTD